MAESTLAQLSQELAALREGAARSIVQVHGRGERPASGVAIAPDTLIVAAHTVDQDEPVAVRFGEQHVQGSVVGIDPGHGVAVVRADRLGAVPVTPASQPPADGELGVVVYRNARALIRSSVVTLHAGVTLPRRSYGGALAAVLHTDFTPVTGWSGGVLVGPGGSAAGLLNGGLVRGVGLVVPIDQALQAARDVQAHGSPKRGWLGIASQPVSLPERQRAGRKTEHGLLIVQVSRSSPAEHAGALVGDVLVSFDGTDVSDPESLLALLAGNRVGRTVPAEVIRGTEVRVLQMNVAERPARG
jgi:S1-C subfamily serine protease